MNWTSSFQIVESSSGRISVSDPPFYLFGGLMLLAGLMISRAAWPVQGAKGESGQFEWLALAVAAPILLFAAVLLTNETRLTLDRGAGEATLRAAVAGIPWRTIRIPLRDVREVLVLQGRAGRTLGILRTNGQTVTMGAYSPRSGQSECAYALNRFIQAPARMDRH